MAQKSNLMSRIQITTDDNGQSTLTINKATPEDSQAYTARATNKVGSIDAKINLNVKGKSIFSEQTKKIFESF